MERQKFLEDIAESTKTILVTFKMTIRG
jgi:hypothetical protein